MTIYHLLAALIVFAIIYSRVMRAPIQQRIERNLAEAQHEHARWVSICLEMTKNGCDAEAKIAAEQVVCLRTEINFYRRMLAHLQQARAKRV